MIEHRANVRPEDLPDPDARPTVIICGYCRLRGAQLAEAASLGWSLYGDDGHCPACPPICYRCGDEILDPQGETLVPATCRDCRGQG